MGDDRIRAKPPPTDGEGWTEGTISGVEESGGRVTVAVDTVDGGRVALSVTREVRDLFVSRLDGAVEGARVWFKKRGR